MSTETDVRGHGHAQFWWAQGVPVDRHLCNVDKYDGSLNIYRPDIYDTISRKISGLDQELRSLSLDIHGAWPRRFADEMGAIFLKTIVMPGHPELGFQEMCVLSAMS
jgi:hypothetical protein